MYVWHIWDKLVRTSQWFFHLTQCASTVNSFNFTFITGLCRKPKQQRWTKKSQWHVRPVLNVTGRLYWGGTLVESLFSFVFLTACSDDSLAVGCISSDQMMSFSHGAVWLCDPAWLGLICEEMSINCISRGNGGDFCNDPASKWKRSLLWTFCCRHFWPLALNSLTIEWVSECAVNRPHFQKSVLGEPAMQACCSLLAGLHWLLPSYLWEMLHAVVSLGKGETCNFDSSAPLLLFSQTNLSCFVSCSIWTLQCWVFLCENSPVPLVKMTKKLWQATSIYCKFLLRL